MAKGSQGGLGGSVEERKYVKRVKTVKEALKDIAKVLGEDVVEEGKTLNNFLKKEKIKVTKEAKNFLQGLSSNQETLNLIKNFNTYGNYLVNNTNLKFKLDIYEGKKVVNSYLDKNTVVIQVNKKVLEMGNKKYLNFLKEKWNTEYLGDIPVERRFQYLMSLEVGKQISNSFKANYTNKIEKLKKVYESSAKVSKFSSTSFENALAEAYALNSVGLKVDTKFFKSFSKLIGGER